MMTPLFPLAPRYRLDDDSIWLEGIDPSRQYWIAVNGCTDLMDIIPGPIAASHEQFKSIVRSFRAMTPGDRLMLERATVGASVHCISSNCFAIESSVNGAPVWHLFDAETVESFLMTASPDWQCSQKGMELGRRQLMLSWTQQAAA